MRSAVSVHDVAAVVAWAINGGATKTPGVYNMGGPQSLSRVDIAKAVGTHLGLPLDRVHSKPRPTGGTLKSPLDITMDSSRLQAVSGLKFRPLSHTVHEAFPPKALWRRVLRPASMLAFFALSATVALITMSYAEGGGISRVFGAR